MNIFAVLDTSDNEEETPRVPAQKKGAKEPANKTDAKNQKAPKPADNKAKTDNGAAKTAPAKTTNDKVKAPKATEAEGEVQKDNNRGGRPRGKEGSRHGEKQHNKEKPQEGQEGEKANKARRPKREFDRRSGTGRGRELSKGGRGSFGFGNVEQDALEAEKDPNTIAEAENETPVVEGEEAGPETESAPEPEPQPTVFTLDEYFKKREEARSNSAILGSKQSTTASVEKATEETTTKATKNSQRSTGKEQLLDVGFKIQTPTYERRERDTRGERGGRGGGRRSNNPKRASGPAVVFDSSDFPSL